MSAQSSEQLRGRCSTPFAIETPVCGSRDVVVVMDGVDRSSCHRKVTTSAISCFAKYRRASSSSACVATRSPHAARANESVSSFSSVSSSSRSSSSISGSSRSCVSGASVRVSSPRIFKTLSSSVGKVLKAFSAFGDSSGTALPGGNSSRRLAMTRSACARNSSRGKPQRRIATRAASGSAYSNTGSGGNSVATPRLYRSYPRRNFIFSSPALSGHSSPYAIVGRRASARFCFNSSASENRPRRSRHSCARWRSEAYEKEDPHVADLGRSEGVASNVPGAREGRPHDSSTFFLAERTRARAAARAAAAAAAFSAFSSSRFCVRAFCAADASPETFRVKGATNAFFVSSFVSSRFLPASRGKRKVSGRAAGKTEPRTVVPRRSEPF